MVIAGKEDFGNNLSNFGKKFLWSRVLTNLGRALLRPRPNDTIIYYYSNYDELLLYHCYLPIYIHATCRYYLLLYMYIGNIYYDIYVYVYMCMCYAMMCYVSHDVCTLHCPLLLCPASLSVRGQVGIGVLLYVHTHIQYKLQHHTYYHYCYYYTYYTIYIYTTTIHIPNMIFVYIILYHVKRLCYTPALVYITLCYTMCICMPHPTVIYDYVL